MRERERERERERDTETERGFSNCLADGWENITAAGRRGVTRGDRLLSILHGIFVWEDLNCNQRSKGMLLPFHIRHLGTGERVNAAGFHSVPLCLSVWQAWETQLCISQVNTCAFLTCL